MNPILIWKHFCILDIPLVYCMFLFVFFLHELKITVIYDCCRVSFLGEVQMYNYGSPRVGNWDFAKAFRKMVPISWRIANPKDIVITVPELLGYTHVHNLMIFDGHGVPGFSVHPGDDDIGVDPSQSEDSKELNKEVGHEHHAKMFWGVIGGSGVADHLEDQYYSSMKRCVSLKFSSAYR